MAEHGKSTARSAVLVGSGIFLSRIAGLVRERIFAYYFGNGDAADIFKAALRIPNVLQNLFGEGVLSASFIPVYARLRAEGREDEAKDIAILVGLLLLGAVMVLVTAGVLFTPILTDLIAPGFEGEKRDYAIRLVRVLFPGVGVLVLSAWCLGILNSHGKFLLSYSAPVIWNAAIIAALLWAGGAYRHYELAMIAGWGVVIGSVLQTGVQVPSAIRILRHRILNARGALPGVRRVLANFGPVVLGRGVVQISAYIDSMLASLLPSGSVAALAYAQTIYLLPVSLFGMAVSAAELPALSGMTIDSESDKKLRLQLDRGLRRISFFVIPSAAAFFFLGDRIASILFETGRFTASDTEYIWGILAGSAVGLLAATMGRLYASVFYALHDTKTPVRYAVVRVLLTGFLGYFCSLHLPSLLGLEPKWGVAGLTASAGIAGWAEFLLLRRALIKRIGPCGLSLRELAPLWGAALLAAAIAASSRHIIPIHYTPALSACVLLIFGGSYLALTRLRRRGRPS